MMLFSITLSVRTGVHLCLYPQGDSPKPCRREGQKIQKIKDIFKEKKKRKRKRIVPIYLSNSDTYCSTFSANSKENPDLRKIFSPIQRRT